jgi:hypothetical protein
VFIAPVGRKTPVVWYYQPAGVCASQQVVSLRSDNGRRRSDSSFLAGAVDVEAGRTHGSGASASNGRARGNHRASTAQCVAHDGNGRRCAECAADRTRSAGLAVGCTARLPRTRGGARSNPRARRLVPRRDGEVVGTGKDHTCRGPIPVDSVGARRCRGTTTRDRVQRVRGARGRCGGQPRAPPGHRTARG